jgi:hypothetical protein
MARSSMLHRWTLRATSVALFFFFATHIAAQEAVYRCGNEYTNDAVRAKSERCKLLESAAVVTIPSHKRAMDVTKRPSQLPASPATTTQKAEQSKRDSDAKLIIELELKKTESQLVDLRKNFDQIPTTAGGVELDKKMNLKQQIARHEADIASLKRELKR